MFSFPIPPAQRTGRSLSRPPSHLPSRFSCEGGGVAPHAAYLRSHCGISCPFCFDRAGGGDESWPCRCPLTAPSHTPLSLCSRVYLRGFARKNTEFSETGGSLAILSPVLLSRWSTCQSCPRPFSPTSRSSLSLHLICPQLFKKKQKPVERTERVSLFWRKGDKIFTLRINCCPEPLV